MSHAELKYKIGPSILSSDLSLLANECQRMLTAGADYLHLDVMDGHFVPNITFGHPVVKCLRPKMPTAPLEVHMMVSSPERWVNDMADAGVNHYTFHVEATDDPAKCIRVIREADMKVGIAIKPKTPVESIFPYLEFVDTVLIMTVEPGFGGQKFMTDMMPKVKCLREKCHHLDIEVDGGVGLANIATCVEAGANLFVSGTAVVNSDNPAAVIHSLRQTIEATSSKITEHLS